MKPVNSPSVLTVVQSGEAEFGPGPAACKVEHVHIVICMMADP